MAFIVNSVNFGISPQSQIWYDLVEGTDHTGRPIYAASKNVDLIFDAMSVSLYSQFSKLNGTSLLNISVLNIDGGSYTSYTNAGIDLMMKNRPSFEAGVTGKFTVSVTGIIP